MADILQEAEAYFQKINRQKDEFLFRFIEKYWPRQITPNQLTVARMAIGALLFYLLFFVRNNDGIIIIPLFLVGILTDLFDGAIARCFHSESHFGSIADPIADRMIILPVALYALLQNPLLLVVLITSEILNALTSLMGAGKKIFFGSNIFGKVKMFLQSVVFLAILAFWPSSPNIFFVYLLWLSMVFMAMSLSHKFSAIRNYYVKKSAEKYSHL